MSGRIRYNMFSYPGASNILFEMREPRPRITPKEAPTLASCDVQFFSKSFWSSPIFEVKFPITSPVPIAERKRARREQGAGVHFEVSWFGVFPSTDHFPAGLAPDQSYRNGEAGCVTYVTRSRGGPRRSMTACPSLRDILSRRIGFNRLDHE